MLPNLYTKGQRYRKRSSASAPVRRCPNLHFSTSDLSYIILPVGTPTFRVYRRLSPIGPEHQAYDNRDLARPAIIPPYVFDAVRYLIIPVSTLNTVFKSNAATNPRQNSEYLATTFFTISILSCLRAPIPPRWTLRRRCFSSGRRPS